MTIHSFADGFEAARAGAPRALELADSMKWFTAPVSMELGDPDINPSEYPYCCCKNQVQWRLSIEEGCLNLRCVKCGSTPEWLSELAGCITMDEILVKVVDTNVPGRNCGCNMMEQLSHDCDPAFVVSVQKTETDMQCPDTEHHGPHVFLVEGRIPAACPGR